MRRLQLLLLAAIAGIGAALTYYYFEYAVKHSIDYVWHDLLDTNQHRLIVVPLCLILTLVYFAVQHLLDPRAEKQESHGLGDAPKPTSANFVKVLGIGFLSLVAGASLGPEAILVPACVLLGSYIGVKLSRGQKQATQLLGMAGFIGLFAAFFNSFFVGLLSLLLIRKEFKIALTPGLVVLTIAASGGSALTLRILKSSAFVETPAYNWSLNLQTVLLLVLLGAAGYAVTYGLGGAHDAGRKLMQYTTGKPWWVHGLFASLTLSLLYLLGGSLVQFTGNESTVPMFKQSADLGLWGLLWIAVIKIAAISWSKASGYRGGLIFPTVFVASVIVAATRLYAHDINLIYGLIAVLIGALYADKRVKILL